MLNYYNFDKFQDEDKINFAWSIYFKYRDNISDECFEFVELLTNLVKQKDYSFLNDKPCVYSLMIFKVINYLFDYNYDIDYILFWLDKIDPKLLSDEPFVTSFGNKIASNKEKYYSFKSKALFNNGDYQESIDVCNEALNSFHNLIDFIWFNKRIAESYQKLEKYDIALKKFNQLINIKKEWYFYRNMAEIYYLKNDLENSLKYAVESMLANGELSKKVNVIHLIGNILMEQDKINNAKKHFYLEYLLRSKEGWSINDDLLDYIENFEVDEKILLKELNEFWINIKFEGQEQLQGVISKILSNGKSGFILGSDYEDYYFNKNSFRNNKLNIKEGLQVKFYTEKSFDKKKNRISLKAINIILND